MLNNCSNRYCYKCGLDFSLRTTAGVLTALGTDISDQAVSDRLSGCAACLSAMLKEMLPLLPNKLADGIGGRWLLIDGSTVQVAGVRGTSYRVHLGWDWFKGEQNCVRTIPNSKISISLMIFN